MIILAILFYLYIIGYIGAGLFQPLNALFLYFTIRSYNQKDALRLRNYMIAVVIYLIFLGVLYYHKYDGALIYPYLFLLPWGLILWYKDITESLKKQKPMIS